DTSGPTWAWDSTCDVNAVGRSEPAAPPALTDAWQRLRAGAVSAAMDTHPEQPADRVPATTPPDALSDAAFAALVERARAQHQADLKAPPEPVEEVPPEHLHRVPAADSPAYAERRAAGEAALSRGEVAALIVAGGAGTRFGGA